MSERAFSRDLEAWLQAAYAGGDAGCPPAELWLEAAALGPEERRRLDEHASGCPACAAERELARLFDAAPGAAEVPPADVDFVVARLAEASPVRPSGRVVPFPATAPRRRLSSPAWRIAALVVLVLGGGLLFRLANPGPPPLPEPGAGGTVRGGTIEAVAPMGDLAAKPAELRWKAWPGAASYRVMLTTEYDRILWEATVPAPPAALPAAVRENLHRAVTYTWWVEALDPAGRRLAESEPALFRARP